MSDQIREFHRAPTVERAVELLQRSDRTTAPLVAGPRLPAAGFPAADAVVDLRGLGLDGIAPVGDAVRLGALTPLQAVVESTWLATLAGGVLPKSAYLAAHFGLRNLATIGGAIDGALADGAAPPEVLLALLALDAGVEVYAPAATQMPLAAYRPGAGLLAAILVPARAGQGALARVARSPLDRAIVAAVAVVVGGVARVAVSGAAPGPITVQAPLGSDPDAAIDDLASQISAGAAPQGDYRGSAAYRLAMAATLARRALTEALD
jgi:CO/xanthine dehydrogenase FAD-binding subunit